MPQSGPGAWVEKVIVLDVNETEADDETAKIPTRVRY